VYSLSGYGHMIADRVRVQAYERALRKTVRPGSVVLEIGTGPGFFALLACQLGARRVYAVESNPAIQVAREIAAANSCADRIEFIEDVSTRVTLPIQADVIVSDLRGILPLFQDHLPSIVDARRRFLAPNGTLIPKRDAIWVSVVEASKEYAKIVGCWEEDGLDLAPARRLAVNDFQKVKVAPEQLLAPPQPWATLEYGTLESPDCRGTVNFSIQRAATAHGLVAWFDTCLTDGVGFSTAPGKPETVYGSMFLPWPEPVSLSEGQNIDLHLEAALVDGNYVWRWTTQIEPGPGGAGLRFQQSQLAGAVISPDRLRRSASDYVPRLTEPGRVHLRSLELMDGANSLEAIARRLAAEFPRRFGRWQQALSYVSKLSEENT
jgi:Arginine methyltransferase oligomerization subdomain/Ribosomal protein L11 methyltransferase (PrmA)